MRRRCLEIDLAPIHRIVVTIGEVGCASQTAHATRTRSGRIGAARTRISTRAAIGDLRDVDFATIARHHVAVCGTLDARFNGAHAHHAGFVRIGQIAEFIAKSAILHGVNGRFATVREITIAICRSGAAWIILAHSIRARLEGTTFVAACAAVVGIGQQNRFAAVDCSGVAIGKSAIALPDAARAALTLPHGIGGGTERVTSAAIVRVRCCRDFASVRRHCVAIVEPRRAGVNRTTAGDALRRCIREHARCATAAASILRIIRWHARVIARFLPRFATADIGFRIELIKILGATRNADTREG